MSTSMSSPIEQIQTERVDDVGLLLGFMLQNEWAELLNQHLGRHPNQVGLDWGWVVVIWLSYIVSQNDHRKVVLQGWVREHRLSLERLCGFEVREEDFTDDRLSLVLRRLSDSGTWSSIERGFSQGSIEVYNLAQRVLRHDATTVNGHHLVTEAGLFQFGHSKDDPSLPQVKVMMSSLDPLGMPLVTQTVPGHEADDGLYWSVIESAHAQLNQSGLLHVGDSKMSAQRLRAQVQQLGDYYLCPLPMTGQTPEQMEFWIDQALTSTEQIQWVERAEANGEVGVIAEGYEQTRTLEVNLDGQRVCWNERVLLVYTPQQAHKQAAGLEQRLNRAMEKLTALTPLPARGRRLYRDSKSLETKVDAILHQYRVEGLLEVEIEQQGERYVIHSVSRWEEDIQFQVGRFGWRPYVTNAPSQGLSLEDAVLTYRDEWSIEQGFRRLKGAQLSLSPCFVQRDDQVLGLINLLSLALRLITLVQYLVRCHLRHQGSTMTGLYPENPHKQTSQPTTERLLKAFDNWTLTTVMLNGHSFTYAPPLSPLQTQILHALALPVDTYTRMARHSQNSS
jgi:transposase